jgi:hypothetical protein
MNVDFIEIGTSDFRTLIEVADDHTVGFSIEPIQTYLDRLPNKPKVEKCCIAISPDGTNGTCEIYHIPPEIIAQENLPYWWKGCNSIGYMHPEAIRFKMEHKFVKTTVPQMSLGDFIELKQIEEIKQLKIDVEGNDCKILIDYYSYLVGKDKSVYPKRIIFEHKHAAIEERNKVAELYAELGYNIKAHTRIDTELYL